MDERIGVSLSRIKAKIGSLRGSTFTTADVICLYSGGYYANKHTEAAYSFNALFGKLLKRNANVLGIFEVKSGVEIKDDNGHKTKASEWQHLTITSSGLRSKSSRLS